MLYANEIDPGLDIPVHIEKFNLGKSKNSDLNVTKTCYIYSNAVVTEINDPGLKGSAKIGIDIINSQKSNHSNICMKNFKKYAYRIIPEGYYDGKIGDYIITKGSDSFGAEYPFQIYNLVNKKEKLVFEGMRGVNLPIKIKRDSVNNLSLNYWTILSNNSNCFIFAPNKNNDCWKQILIENNMDSKINLQDCLKSVKENFPGVTQSELEKSSIQTLINIEIQNIKHPKDKKLLNNIPKCYISP